MQDQFGRIQFYAVSKLFNLADAVAGWIESGLLKRVALGLAIGAVGALIANAAHMPLAFMLGSLFACMAASIAGLPVASTPKLRMAFLALVGLFLGESFDQEAVAQIANWPISIAMACLYVPVASWIAYLFYARAANLDKMTAVMSAIPGGLSGVVMMSEALGAQERSVTLTQSLRIAIVVLAAPAIFFGVLDAPLPTSHGADDAAPMLTWTECGLLASASAALMMLCSYLGIPLAVMIAPMTASAILRMSGLVEGALPLWLVEIALIVTGSSLGCRFKGAPLKELTRLAGWTALGTLLMVLVSAGFALIAAPLVGVSFAAALLAFMPGGVAEMCIIALAMQLEPSFVATHHMARILFILATLPIFAWVLARAQKK